MKRHWGEMGFKVALFLTIAIAGFGEGVLQLWNWLMPSLFGLHPITFWQAVGLLSLSWILFGGWRGFPMGRGPSMRWRRLDERLAHMTPEEQEKFRQGMGRRCGGLQSPASEPKA